MGFGGRPTEDPGGRVYRCPPGNVRADDTVGQRAAGQAGIRGFGGDGQRIRLIDHPVKNGGEGRSGVARCRQGNDEPPFHGFGCGGTRCHGVGGSGGRVVESKLQPSLR